VPTTRADVLANHAAPPRVSPNMNLMAIGRRLLGLSAIALASAACGEEAPPLMGASGSGGVASPQAGAATGGASGSIPIGTAGTVGTAGSGTSNGGTSGGQNPTGAAGSGVAQGGSAGSGGSAGLGGAAGSGGAPGGGGGLIPLKNPPVKSVGCDKATTVTTGEKTIMSGGRTRRYTIDVPQNYDMSKPYRFIYASHWIGSEDEAVVRQNYYHLKPKADADGEPAIFVAPQAGPDDTTGTWSSSTDVDHIFFDDILKFVKENLCIDTTRVFAIGFSFGGMQTWSLSVNHQKDIRAAVGIAPANWNIYQPQKTHLPIGWMQTTGTSDNLCSWVNSDAKKEGAKYIALEHAADNGCTLPADIPRWQQGEFFCYDFEGCKPGYPTKACTFQGGHVSTDIQPWIAVEAWKFFKQY
jgi:poly(3-hydroxybutyrate) depolymerase